MSLYFNVWYSIGWYFNVGILMGVIFFTQYSNDYILIRAHLQEVWGLELALSWRQQRPDPIHH